MPQAGMMWYMGKDRHTLKHITRMIHDINAIGASLG
jgi:hypothetical protein